MDTDTIAADIPNSDGAYDNLALDIEDVPANNEPSIKWGPQGPLLYIYEPESEEPVFVISLPSEDDPEAALLKTPSWYAPDYQAYTQDPSK